MTHTMKLDPLPFDMVAKGQKTFELRLNDEKRQAIAVGHKILFTKTGSQSEQLLTEVIGLHRFPSFRQLYRTLPLDKCGYLPQEVHTASAKDMEVYYSEEAQTKYGVLGIELKLL